MTDTFANGPGAPGGLPAEASERVADVTGTLAELERKLREVERELTSIGRRRVQAPGEETHEPAEASAAPMPESPAPRAAEPTGRLVDETLEPPPRFAAQSTRTAPAAPSPASYPSRSTPPPRQAAQPSRQSPSPRQRPSDAQLASLAELRRFRDRLERFARELTSEYDALLGRVMAGLSSAPAQPERGAAEALRPEPLRPETLRPDPEAPAPTAPSPPPSPEDALFEGRVELGVGPFYDIGSLGAFERQLASLPGVSEASVRRFEASHAVVDVRLATPIALLRELRRSSHGDFSVREIASGRVLLTFDDV